MKRIEDMVPPSFKLLNYIESERLALFMAGVNHIDTLFDLRESLEQGEIHRSTYDDVSNFHYFLISNLKEEFRFKQKYSSYFTLEYTLIYKIINPNTLTYERIHLDKDDYSECNSALIRTGEAFYWANEQFAKMYGEPEQETTPEVKPNPGKLLRENEKQTLLKIIAGLSHIIENSNMKHLKGNMGDLNISSLIDRIYPTIEQVGEDGSHSISVSTITKKLKMAREAYPNLKKLNSPPVEE